MPVRQMQVRIVALICSLAMVAPAKEPATRDWCGGATASWDAGRRHREIQTMMQRFAATGSVLSLAPSPDAVGTDVGNIAVIDDSDGVRIRRNPFNLQLKRLTFARSAGKASYKLETSNVDFDAAAASASTRLEGLDDDDTREVPLPFDFPFFGGVYKSVFVNSDGNVSFGQSDGSSSDRTLSRMTAGPPRIAALYADLNPAAGLSGGVRILSDERRMLISWVNVPFWATPRYQNFQIALYPTGNIEVTYGDTNVVSDDAVVGISPGNLEGSVRLIPLVNGSNGEEFPATVAEIFAGRETYDVTRAIQRFYATHDDAYTNIFVFNTLQLPSGLCSSASAIACTDVVRNRVEGIGKQIADDGAYYGSPKRLEAVIDMGGVDGYSSDPYQTDSRRLGAGDTGLTIFTHEATHRYLVWFSQDDTSVSRLLPGGADAHWSFNFNSEGSMVEGNRLQDNGSDANPRFLSAGAAEQIPPVDQYFFGWRAPQDVPPTFAVSRSTVSDFLQPRIGARFNGQRRDVTIQELIDAARAPRYPDHVLAPRKYRWAILLITREGAPAPTAAIEKLERYRQELPAFWSKISGGLSELDTEQKKSLDISIAPFAEFYADSTVGGEVRLRNAAASDLRVSITASSPDSELDIPAEVTIPAGSVSVAFQLKTKGPGRHILTFRPSDNQYETVEVRLRTISAPATSQSP